MSNPALAVIFEKLMSSDKDFRYMATSDLLQELKKESLRLDVDTERKICRVVLQQMQDISGDISNLAIKCLGALALKIQDSQVGEIADTLCRNLTSEKKTDIEKRDVASIGLKALIGEVSSVPAGNVVVKKVVPHLINSLHSKDTELVIQTLDIMRDLTTKFGHQMEWVANDIQNSLTPKLEEERGAIRKRAIQCLGVLAVHLADEPLDTLIGYLVMGISANSSKPMIVSTYVQAVGCVSQTVGYRFGKHLNATVPLIIKTMEEAEEDEGELKEMGLHALETFVNRCPAQIKGMLDEILDASLLYLKHDPNFAAEVSDEEEDPMDYEEEEGEDAEEEDEDYSDEYTDDDDESWKVRRAAAHCLSALFLNSPDQIISLYSKAVPELMKRFSEREENVRVDVFNAYVDLLRQISRISKHLGEEQRQRIIGNDMSSLMKSLSKQLKEKSIRTRIGAFIVLREVIAAIPKSIAQYSGLFVNGIKRALLEKTGQSDLKIEALLFLKKALACDDHAAFCLHILPLSDSVFASVQERYYKVTSEALRVCREMVRAIRPDISIPIDESLRPVVVSLFDSTMGRLGAQDQDQEVKECAIKCAAVAIKLLGDVLPDKVQVILSILLDRAKSETTRLTTVKAINTIAQSELDLDLQAVLEPAVVGLTDFLRKSNMVLRQASLEGLESLCSRLGSQLHSEVIGRIVLETSALVDERDLHLAAQSLILLRTLLEVQPSCGPQVVDKGLAKATELMKSTLLQGAALESLQCFFAAVAACSTMNATFDDLFTCLMNEGIASGGKVQQLSVARCMASLCCEGQPQELPSAVNKLMNASQHLAGSQRLVLLCLGELGRRRDLSEYGDFESLLIASLSDPSEEIQSAASFALGAITFGNLERYLCSLLDKIKASIGTSKLYLLLQALNEAIRSVEKVHTMQFTKENQEAIVEILLACCESEEECRNVVAECFGHLAVIHPNYVFGVLSEKMSDESPSMRYTVITSVKYTILDRETSVDPVLHSVLPTYLRLMEDEDRHVRKATVQVLSSILTHKVALVEEHLSDILPMLYKQTVKRKDLIRILDLGPFKLEVDDGLELRKSAFECMDLLLDACPRQLDTPEFVQHLLDGLSDDADIRMLCHPMLSKLCAMAETEVMSKLDRFVEPLQKTLMEKLKGDAVKHEKDRHEDMLRSCLRCVVVLNQLPAAASNQVFKRFMDVTVQKGEMKTRFADLVRERAEAEGNSSVDLGRLSGGFMGLPQSISL